MAVGKQPAASLPPDSDTNRKIIERLDALIAQQAETNATLQRLLVIVEQILGCVQLIQMPVGT